MSVTQRRDNYDKAHSNPMQGPHASIAIARNIICRDGRRFRMHQAAEHHYAEYSE